MFRIIKMLAIFMIAMFSCSMPVIVPPKLAASQGHIEAMRLYCGKLYVIKSDMVGVEKYWDISPLAEARKRCWVEIYAAVNGQIVMIKILEAEKLPDTWVFKEFKKEIN